MTWRERRGPATFRGVPFHVEAGERGGGRRVVRHDFALRDKPHHQDLGRRARTFNVEGYVIGDDYLVKRDALIGALEREGPGELVHPHHGTIRAVALEFTLRETDQEGGLARFSIDFEEADPSALYPVATPDGPALVAAGAEVARRAVGDDFSVTYRPVPGLLDSAVGALRGATKKINDQIGRVQMATQRAADLRRRIDEAQRSARALAGAPGGLLAALAGIFELLPGTLALAVYDFAAGPTPPATTPARRQEQENHEAIKRLVQRFAVIGAAEAAPLATYDSHEAAVVARQAIADKLEEQIEIAGDDVFAALVRLRADLVRAVPGEGANLARLLSHTPRATVPSLVLAFELYGDLSREADVLTRNRIAHPGFVPGGVPLEIRSRD